MNSKAENSKILNLIKGGAAVRRTLQITRNKKSQTLPRKRQNLGIENSKNFG